MTLLVAGRVAEFWCADAIQLSNLLWAGMSVEEGGYLTWPVTVAVAVARDLGRVAEQERAKKAATDVVECRTSQADWPQMLRELAAAIAFKPGEATRPGSTRLPSCASVRCSARYSPPRWSPTV